MQLSNVLYFISLQAQSGLWHWRGDKHLIMERNVSVIKSIRELKDTKTQQTHQAPAPRGSTEMAKYEPFKILSAM